ncbi:leucine--tRNA ligase [candidate division KSB1 bacterium]|nr:leucine--tRNA ligase [candidate division KSB1 bacterium]
MKKNPFADIEKKWQDYWKNSKQYEVDLVNADNKLYVLVMFIYPSGDKLHIGHWYNYGPTDTWARFKKMQGFTVMEPIGYDAFGLPAENYAIKQGVHPAISTAKNINKIREQLKAIGAMYDWSKEINTSSPQYYKWTQWLFLQLYKNGLAYRKKAPVNWCPDCDTVLANEQVINGNCERCDHEVTKKDLVQWFFKITAYADRLLEDFNKIQWPAKTVTMQRNWIGRSEGTLIKFDIPQHSETLEVFTTRADTLFGATYMVLAPEHPLVDKITSEENRVGVINYKKHAKKVTEIERTSTEREKTGVFTGAYAVNPINQEKVPIWIADYVLIGYGAGAVMAVPAHDERDFEFAQKFNLEIRQVISVIGKTHKKLEQALTEYGMMINSDQFNGQDSKTGMNNVTNWLKEKNAGKSHIILKLRDWLISRQRYWGAPIPIVFCENCGEVPVNEEDLPVKLPEFVDFTGKGKSPLASNEEFINTACPKCAGPATREVDTMDTFVDSSWYFLRYINPKLDSEPWQIELANKWLPVDQYVGGAEHAVLHLLYARFITKVLYDLKYINFDEPFKRLIHQGIITNRGAKMSKSKHNVVNPDNFINKFGSDTFRMFMMFMGSYEDGGDWNDEGISGVFRFLNRIDRLIDDFSENPPNGDETLVFEEVEKKRHYTIKTVTQDLDRFQFNTAISRLMEFFNSINKYRNSVDHSNQNKSGLATAIETLITLLAPFAPHLSEELWSKTGRNPSIFNQTWPEYDENKLKVKTVNMVVQVNGKLRGQLTVETGLEESKIIEEALQVEKVKKYTTDKRIIKSIVIPQKLVNFVTN